MHELHLVPSLLRLCVCTTLLTALQAMEDPTLAPGEEPSEDAIVVTATRVSSPAGSATQVVHTLDAQDTRLAGEFTKPLDMLDQLPGVFTIGGLGGGVGGATYLTIRGSGSEGTRLLVDGVPLTMPWASHGQFALESLPLSATLGGVDLVKGVQPIYGSNAVGGVVNQRSLRPTSAHEQAVRLEVGSFDQLLGLVSATGMVDENWGYAVSASYFDTSGQSAQTASPDGNPQGHEEDGLTRGDATARVEYQADWGLAYASLLVIDSAHDYDAFAQPDSAHEEVRLQTLRAGTGAVWQNGADWELQTDLAYTDYSGTRHEGDPAIDTDSEGTDTWFALRAQNTSLDHLTLSLGADHLASEAHFYSTGYPPPDYLPVALAVTGDTATTGLWGRGVYQADGYELDATLRGESHSEAGEVVTWRLGGATWCWAQRIRLFASIGSGFRAPTVWELNDPNYGNPDLKSERSLAYEIGQVSSLTEGLTLSTTCFRTDFTDQITFDPVTFVSVNDAGESWAQGIESALAWDPTEGQTRFSLSHTYLETEDSAGERPDFQPWNTASFATTYFWLERTVWAGMRVDWVDGYNTYDGAIASRTLVGCQAGWQIDERYRVYGRVDNVFDTLYQPNVGYTGERRNAVLGVAARF